MEEHKEYLMRYIQSLPDDALDRIVEAQEWCSGAFMFPGITSARCLVGHAENWRESECGIEFDNDLSNARQDLGYAPDEHFDLWCGRYPNTLGIRHTAVQFVKQVAAEEIQKRHVLQPSEEEANAFHTVG